jgi:DNA-binding Lrp family transcriptional regulator
MRASVAQGLLPCLQNERGVNKRQSAAASLREAVSRCRVVCRGNCSLRGPAVAFVLVATIPAENIQLGQPGELQLVSLINRRSFERQEMIRLQELDATDKRILNALDDDPRVPIMVLAQKLGLARGTVQSRLERMTASGALRPNSSRVLPAALGRGVAAAVSAELDQSHLNEAIAALRKIPEVLECHAPAGDTDLLIRVVATSPDDLYRVSEEIRLCPGIVRTSTSMFLREVIPYRTTGLLKE